MLDRIRHALRGAGSVGIRGLAADAVGKAFNHSVHRGPLSYEVEGDARSVPKIRITKKTLLKAWQWLANRLITHLLKNETGQTIIDDIGSGQYSESPIPSVIMPSGEGVRSGR